jgi:hypothetical protein
LGLLIFTDINPSTFKGYFWIYMKKYLLLLCLLPLMPLGVQAGVSLDINIPGVSLHLGDQDSRGYFWDGYDWRPPQWWHEHRGGHIGDRNEHGYYWDGGRWQPPSAQDGHNPFRGQQRGEPDRNERGGHNTQSPHNNHNGGDNGRDQPNSPGGQGHQGGSNNLGGANHSQGGANNSGQRNQNSSNNGNHGDQQVYPPQNKGQR